MVAPVVDLNGAAAGNGTTLAYTENAGATAIAPAGVTTDVDSPDFNGGSLTVHFSANGATEDQLSILTDGTVTVSSGTVSVSGLAIGTVVSGGANGSDLVVSFNTTDATPAAVSTLIEHIGYADNSDNPSTATRSVLFTVNDGSGGNGSDTATVSITAVNDAPALANVDANAAYTENAGPVALDTVPLIVPSDADNSTLSSATIAITSGFVPGDLLDFPDFPIPASLSASYDANTGVLSINAIDTLADYQEVLRGITFSSTSDDPGPSRTITWTVTDAGSPNQTSAAVTTTIAVTQVNDAPVNTVPAGPLSTPEDTALAITGLSVSDVDIETGNITVTLSVAHGTIHVRDDLGPGFLDPGDFSGGSNDTSSVTFSCDPAFVNATLAALNGVVYTPDPNYNGGDTLTMLSDDGGATGSGGALTDSDPVAINVTAVDDAPVLSNVGDPGDTPAFTENGAAVVLDADNNASVSDTELDGSPNHYAGATLTLARSGGANADDVFGSVGSLDLTDSNGLGENLSLDGGATFIGTWSQPGDGSISFTFNANATAADINSVMRQITYLNTSDNPQALAPIDFTFNDGNGGPGGQNQGSGAGSTTQTITVQITQIDDAPVLSNVAASAAYSPGSAGAVLSTANVITDVDATAPSPITGIHSATVQIAAGFLAGDVLFVNLPSSGGLFLTADGDPTNISGSYAAGTLTLSGQDSIQHYQQILDAIAYRSTAADPSNAGADPNRTITWQVNDGALNSQTPAPAVGDNGPVNETVLHFDVAPAVDLDGSSPGTGFTTTYTENQAPIAIVNNDSVTDSDTANADTMTIVLTNAMTGDSLSVAGSLPGGISSSVDTSVPGQIALRLANSAAMADYQTALAQVRFASSSDNPDPADRDITVVLSESGGFSSNTAHATVHVIRVNDAPVAANGSASGNEDTVIPGSVSATDVDNTPDQLSFSLVGSNGGAAHGTVVFHADGSYTYTPAHDFNGSDSFSFKANDGHLDSNVATESLIVNAVNDAPVAANGSAGGNEDTAIAGAVSASDVDNTPAQLSYALVGANGGAAHGTVALNANGSFTYTPVANFNGSDSFSFKASDGALNSNIATESLTISAVNDAPVNSVPGALSVDGVHDAAITGLAVSDVDAVSLTTSLHVEHGTLTVAAVGGAAVVGSGSGTVTLSGSVAQIDATLGAASNVLYHSAFDFNGTDQLTMTSNDGGSTGSGGPQTDIDIVDILVAGSSLAPPHLPFSGSAGSGAGFSGSFGPAFPGLGGVGFPLTEGLTSSTNDTSHVADASLDPPHLGSLDFHLP